MPPEYPAVVPQNKRPPFLRRVARAVVTGGAIGFGSSYVIKLLPFAWRLAADGGLMVAILCVLWWIRRDMAVERVELEKLTKSVERVSREFREARAALTEHGAAEEAD